jgi:hypothetical protein
MRFALVLAVSCVSALGGAAHAQEQPRRLLVIRGTVTDSVLSPVPGVLVSLATARTYVVTDTAGRFVLTDVEPGPDTLHVRARGFAPRSFRMMLSDTTDVGMVVLRPGLPPVLSLRVTVRDTVAGKPIAEAEVVLNERVIGSTTAAGGLRLDSMPVEWGINSVLVRRIGYAPMLAIRWVDDMDGSWSVNAVLQRQAVDMPAVVVEADRVTLVYGHMRDFWLRRERGWGRYFTAADIERRRPVHVSDMLFGVPGLRVWRTGGTTAITCAAGGTPTVWVDGFPLEGWDLDSSVRPSHVAGIEIYSYSPSTPPEFVMPGSGECGAIVVWTK